MTNAPTGTSATKLRNWLVKTYEAERFPTSGSNPFSTTQSLNAKIYGARRAKEIANDLALQGWVVTRQPGRHHAGTMFYDVQHTDGGHITMHDTNGTETLGEKPFTFMTAFGVKPAKNTSFSYYD